MCKSDIVKSRVLDSEKTRVKQTRTRTEAEFGLRFYYKHLLRKITEHRES